MWPSHSPPQSGIPEILLLYIYHTDMGVHHLPFHESQARESNTARVPIPYSVQHAEAVSIGPLPNRVVNNPP